MPKLKTKKGAAKRFKLTKGKKIKYLASGKGHLLSGKSAARLRRLRRPKTVKNKRYLKYLKRMLPYG